MASLWSESVSGTSAGWGPLRALDLRRLRRSMMEAGEAVEEAGEMGGFGVDEPVVVPVFELIVHLIRIISRGRCQKTPKATRLQRFPERLANHSKEQRVSQWW
jgi:hypothetical protein